MDDTKLGADRDVMEAASDYFTRELSGGTTRGKPRGTPRHRRPKLRGTPAADAVKKDRR